MAEIKTEIRGSTINIAITGALNSQSAPELHEIIMDAVPDVTEMNFDFADIEYLTSAGLREILRANRQSGFPHHTGYHGYF